MVKILEKVERRLGEKLFIKGDRCLGPKCAMVRRAYVPGVHGKKRAKRREKSEYSTLMNEKQKIRFLYGLDDREVKRYSKDAASRGGIFSLHFLRQLESRLDNVVFRLGLGDSRRAARQIITHGHIMVNGKPLRVPSYQAKKGDTIGLKERSLSGGIGIRLEDRLKKHQPPKWLMLDPNKKEGSVIASPETEDAGIVFEATKIKEFYSR